MHIIAIEKLLKAEDSISEKDKKTHLQIISKQHKKGFIRGFWANGKKPGHVLLFESNRDETVKAFLRSLPMVKRKTLTYSLSQIDAFEAAKMLGEKNNYLTIVYASKAYKPFDSTMLHNLLHKARENNSKLAITGILLYENRSFLQIIEGRHRAIRALYDQISQDTRHSNVIKILELESDQKTFSNWSMGYANVTSSELESIEGMNDFFKNKNRFDALESQQVKKILQEFKTGKWRQKIS